jgi:hypothetical protein
MGAWPVAFHPRAPRIRCDQPDGCRSFAILSNPNATNGARLLNNQSGCESGFLKERSPDARFSRLRYSTCNNRPSAANRSPAAGDRDRRRHQLNPPNSSWAIVSCIFVYPGLGIA